MVDRDENSASSNAPMMRVSIIGTRKWYLHGELHRADGPAVEMTDGSRLWYLNGQRHRADGPAVEMADGTRKWHLHGELHRADGPAVEMADGTRAWCLNGQRHRIDGPALDRPDGIREWCLAGVRLTPGEHAAFRELSTAEQETVLVFLADGMLPSRAIDLARLVLA